MKVSTRLILAFSSIVVILVALAATAFYNLERLAEAERWNVHTYRVLQSADSLLESLVNIETGQRGFSLSGADASLEPLVAGKASFARELTHIKEQTADNAAQQARWQRLEQLEQQWLQNAVEPAIALRRAVAQGTGNMEAVAAEERTARGKQQMDAMRQVISEAKTDESVLLDQRSATAADIRALTKQTLIVGALLAVVLAGGVGAALTRSFRKQLGGELLDASAVAREIAAGNLNVAVDAREGDTQSLLAAMKAMRDSLAGVVIQVRAGTHAITNASREIAAGNTDLSSRTEEQAASLEQTAASMEELTSIVRQNAENAQQASALASDASNVAQQGSQVVARVVATMTDIGTHSERIADITGMIDAIAFQTNILALNAAVEAARAGEQGRGFAVVASEVRTLAQRAATAAKEIKNLIDASVQRIHEGQALVDEAGATMDGITQAIGRATGLMGEIAAASSEQSRGIEQINQAVTQMDEVTQQNAALVEQAAAASKSLEDQSRQLDEAVMFFKLEHAADARAVLAPAKSTTSTTRAVRRVSAKTHAMERSPAPAERLAAGASWQTF